MVGHKVIFIPRNKTNIVLIIFLLLVLGYTGIKSSYTDEKPALAYAVSNKVIVLDAGHGGKDPGAVRGEYREKDITLAISKNVQNYLSQAGAVVIMTRDKDCELVENNFKGTFNQRKRKDLTNRVNKANQAKADLYISIHTNADVSPQWSGAQTFYSASSEPSKLMAESIQQELTTILGNTKRKAKTGSYFVIDNTKMTTVIVEVGFISNPGEAILLGDEEYQKKVAYAIYSGIVKAQNGNDSSPVKAWQMRP